eukprot:CAMPEP_0179066130 /NCGR_PEP_ID=MMETSP0796-20121207/28820_1 /TAXON_ID=73915 /ORGANISM="Pyrodinium bahamense, Strain pbaha01" /LENGTH=394 /DNA_ID=CAMNT_0020763129 /DNA_START=85 /DNA_END=1267 /DNA_ORIENTATION=+
MSAFEADFEAALDGDAGDVTLRAMDGERLRAHSQILQLCSPVFRAELTGPMQEAQTKCLTMDCDRCTAAAFLRFLYVGRLGKGMLSSLEVILGLVRLADYYGVIEQFATAFAQEEAQTLFASLLDSTMGPLQDPSAYGAEILSQLRPLIAQRKSLANPVVERLKLRFGCNVFKCLCYARARDLPEVQEACQRVCFPARETSELQLEVNEATVLVLLEMYPEMPAVVLHALLDFISLLSGKLPGACRARPAVGHLIRMRAGSRPDGPLASGAVGELIRDDKSACPFLVKVGGDMGWYRAEEVEVVVEDRLSLNKLSSLIPMVQSLVALAEERRLEYRAALRGAEPYRRGGGQVISRDRAELGAISAGVLSSSLDVMEMASAPVSLQAGVAVGKQW